MFPGFQISGNKVMEFRSFYLSFSKHKFSPRFHLIHATHSLIHVSVLAESLRSLSIAPLLLMLSSRVLTNCFPHFIGKASATRVSLPTNTWACLTPLSTAGVSEKTVSVATGSCLLGMLSAGFLDYKCFFIGNVLGMETPHWVDYSMVF